jgi:pre-mRNA-splicing factor SYF1
LVLFIPNRIVDIEESLGTFQTTKAAYDKIIELRVATPHIILNYAAWLEEHKHFEEAFKAYEKGVALFNFPYVHDILSIPLLAFPFPSFLFYYLF